jgi:intracellular multiplication protein IcmE
MTDDENTQQPHETENAAFNPEEPYDFEEGAHKTLLDQVKTNPVVKLGIVVGAFAIIIGGVVFLGGKKKALPSSAMRGVGAQGLNEVPTTAEVSKNYKDAVEETNVQNVEKAVKEGGSALPVPVAAPVGRLGLPDAEQQTEDPLERWRRIQEERQHAEAPQKPANTQQIDPNAEVTKNLATAMATQMQTVLQGLTIAAPQIKQITPVDYMDNLAKKQQQSLQTLAQAGGLGQAANGAGVLQSQQQGSADVDIIVPAGTVEYAQLLTEANSDTPSQILGQILSGPLTGARIIGDFQSQQDTEVITLTFHTVILDGISYPTNALALDPKTTTPGMVTDVDHRYFTRIVLPAAAAFVQGFGNAVSQAGNTSVSVNGSQVTSSTVDLNPRQELFSAIEKAAEQAGTVFNQAGQQTKTLIRVAAGTPMALFFTQPVVKARNQKTASGGAGGLSSQSGQSGLAGSAGQ